MTVTFENLNDRHIDAVQRYATEGGKKTLLAACKRARARVDVLDKIGAMRKVADAYNKLYQRGFFGSWSEEERKP